MANSVATKNAEIAISKAIIKNLVVSINEWPPLIKHQKWRTPPMGPKVFYAVFVSVPEGLSIR